MRKIMKKKVNVFGKKLPVFAILLVGMAVMVSAALITYWGTITGLVIISQGLILDGGTWDVPIEKTWDSFTSLEAMTFVSAHNLKNTADVNAEVELVKTCTPNTCNAVDEPSVNYYTPSMASIIAGADRLVATQNTDGGWEWNNPDTIPDGTSGVNTFGVTALGLLDAYRLTGDSRYLVAAEVTGESLVLKVPHITDGKFYSQDIEFLAELGEITDDTDYTNKAKGVMTYFMDSTNRYCASGCSASELAAFYESLYPTIAGLTEWQLASWVRAAQAVEEITWANDMINEMNADISGTPYFDITNSGQDNYILGLSGIISATGNSDVIDKLIMTQENNGEWIEHEGTDTNQCPSNSICSNGFNECK